PSFLPSLWFGVRFSFGSRIFFHYAIEEWFSFFFRECSWLGIKKHRFSPSGKNGPCCGGHKSTFGGFPFLRGCEGISLPPPRRFRTRFLGHSGGSPPPRRCSPVRRCRDRTADRG